VMGAVVSAHLRKRDDKRWPRVGPQCGAPGGLRPSSKAASVS